MSRISIDQLKTMIVNSIQFDDQECKTDYLNWLNTLSDDGVVQEALLLRVI